MRLFFGNGLCLRRRNREPAGEGEADGDRDRLGRADRRSEMEDALAQDKLIAMAVLAEGWEDDYEGRPALHPVVRRRA